MNPIIDLARSGLLILVLIGSVQSLVAGPDYEKTATVEAAENLRFLALSPDQRLLVTVSGDSAPVLWDGWSGTQLGQLPIREATAQMPFFSPGGEFLATFHEPSTYRIWRIRDGESYVRSLNRPVGEFTPSRKEVQGKKGVHGSALHYRCATFSRDEQTFYVGTNQGYIIAWNIETRRETGRSVYQSNLPWRTHIDQLYTPVGAGVIALQGYTNWLGDQPVGIRCLRIFDGSLRPVFATSNKWSIIGVCLSKTGNRLFATAGSSPGNVGHPRNAILAIDLAAATHTTRELETPADLHPFLPTHTPVVLGDDAFLGLYAPNQTAFRLMELPSHREILGPNRTPRSDAATLTGQHWLPGGDMLIQSWDNREVALYRVENMSPEAAWARALSLADRAMEAYANGFGEAAVDQFLQAIEIDHESLRDRIYFIRLARAGMPHRLSGEIIWREFEACVRDQKLNRIRLYALHHALFAIAAGQPTLARATLDYLKDQDADSAPGNRLADDRYQSSYLAAIEALLLAVEGQRDAAYGRLLQHGPFEAQFVYMMTAGNDGHDTWFSAKPWAPLFADTKRLGFVLKLEESDLQSVIRRHGLEPDATVTPQPYPGLDGRLVLPPPAQPPPLLR